MKDAAVTTDTVATADRRSTEDRLLPGAEPWRAGPEGPAEVGVLLCHGFTGSPHSMRPWGEYLAAAHPDYAIDLQFPAVGTWTALKSDDGLMGRVTEIAVDRQWSESPRDQQLLQELDPTVDALVP